VLKFLKIYCFLIFFLFATPLFAARQSIRVTVPKTAYIQWLSHSEASMTAVGETSTFVELSGDEMAPNQELYLGIMCNSLDGYEIRLISAHPVDTNTAEARDSNGSVLHYTADLEKVTHTFRGQSMSSLSLDLTGSQPSIRLSFYSGGALPLEPFAPNVFRLTVTANTNTRKRGIYTDRITAILNLP